MNSPLFYILLIGVAAAAKFATGFYAKIAAKHGIVDKADGSRKLQEKPVPVSGGVAVFTTLLLAVAASLAFYHYRCPGSDIPIWKITLLLGSSMVLVLTGFLDDKKGMKGKVKLLLQIAASLVVVAYARNYHAVELFGKTVELGHLLGILAVFWLVGFINAINLIDGADGVASTIGITIFVTTGIIGLLQGHAYYTIAFMAFMAAAALFGFFLCNKPPAKIYLGDSGSMLIGFLAGILLLNVCSVGRGTIRFFPAFTVAFLPILDSFSAIVRRVMAGRSIYFADRSHLHHRIQNRIGKNWILLITLFLLQLPLSAGAVWGITQKNTSHAVSDFIPLGAAFLVLLSLIITNIFGRNELKLMLLFGGKVVKRIFGSQSKNPKRQKMFINLNEEDWKNLWNSIVKQVGDQTIYLSLDINIASLEVDFFATQGTKVEEKGISADPRSILTLRLPLMAEENHYCGNLILQYNLLNHDPKSAVEQAEKLRDESVTAVKNFIAAHKQP